MCVEIEKDHPPRRTSKTSSPAREPLGPCRPCPPPPLPLAFGRDANERQADEWESRVVVSPKEDGLPPLPHPQLPPRAAPTPATGILPAQLPLSTPPRLLPPPRTHLCPSPSPIPAGPPGRPPRTLYKRMQGSRWRPTSGLLIGRTDQPRGGGRWGGVQVRSGLGREDAAPAGLVRGLVPIHPASRFSGRDEYRRGGRLGRGKRPWGGFGERPCPRAVCRLGDGVLLHAPSRPQSGGLWVARSTWPFHRRQPACRGSLPRAGARGPRAAGEFGPQRTNEARPSCVGTDETQPCRTNPENVWLDEGRWEANHGISARPADGHERPVSRAEGSRTGFAATCPRSSRGSKKPEHLTTPRRSVRTSGPPARHRTRGPGRWSTRQDGGPGGLAGTSPRGLWSQRSPGSTPRPPRAPGPRGARRGHLVDLGALGRVRGPSPGRAAGRPLRPARAWSEPRARPPAAAPSLSPPTTRPWLVESRGGMLVDPERGRRERERGGAGKGKGHAPAGTPRPRGAAAFGPGRPGGVSARSAQPRPPGPWPPWERGRGAAGPPSPHPPPAAHRSAAPAALPFPRPSPGRGPGGGRRGGGAAPRQGRAGVAPRPHLLLDLRRPAAGGGAAPERAVGEGPTDGRDKPLCRGLTFNRSQRGSCSATYETLTQKQVVYEWFSARFPTNVRCVTGEGAAAFPAAPCVPGRGALRTGPRSRCAAGARRAGGDGGDPAIRGQPRLPRRCRIVPPGRDSDLEAFSHNPTDGSFAPLAPQPSTYTKCLNLRFLSRIPLVRTSSKSAARHRPRRGAARNRGPGRPRRGDRRAGPPRGGAAGRAWGRARRARARRGRAGRGGPADRATARARDAGSPATPGAPRRREPRDAGSPATPGAPRRREDNLAMGWFRVEQGREEDNVKDVPGPDWCDKMYVDAVQGDEKP
nr:collagen alpha-1(III) chain-like [Equus caballus]